MSNRRDFIMLLGGAAAGWPLAAGAQQGGVPIVGRICRSPARRAGRASGRCARSSMGYST
jgi:hypothetical protein